MLCALFDIPPDQALALSLVKRAADVALGVPGLLVWQIAEGRRLRIVGGAGKPQPEPIDKPSAGL